MFPPFAILQVRVDARYATAMVNLLCIESFASKLCPSYNLLDESEGLLRAHEALGQRTLERVLPLISPAIAVRAVRTCGRVSGLGRATFMCLCRTCVAVSPAAFSFPRALASSREEWLLPAHLSSPPGSGVLLLRAGVPITAGVDLLEDSVRIRTVRVIS